MIEENPYYPFKSFVHDDTISLMLLDLKWDAFENNGFLGNGHDWNRLIVNILKEKSLNLLTTLEFDSEADMFCVRSKDNEPLQEITKIVSSFYDDEKKLLNYIKKYAQYE